MSSVFYQASFLASRGARTVLHDKTTDEGTVNITPKPLHEDGPGEKTGFETGIWPQDHGFDTRSSLRTHPDGPLARTTLDWLFADFIELAKTFRSGL
jgi:hypothetical protein